jgi:hypothetical protein
MALTLAPAAVAHADNSGTGFYSGSIFSTRFPSLDVAMSLCTRGSSVTGSYFYLNVATDIALRGTLAPDGTLELAETNAKGEVTGRWTGRLTERFEGTWTPPKGDARQFKLRRMGAIPADSSRGTSARVEPPCSDIGYRWARTSKPGSFNGNDKPDRTFLPRLVRFRDKKIMANVNSFIDAAAGSWFEEIRDEARNNCEEPTSGRPEDANHYYETEVGVEYAGHDIFSIRILGNRGCNGATGVNGLLDGSMTYDLKTGERVLLETLFREDMSWGEVNRLLFAYQLAEAAKPKGDECFSGYKTLETHDVGFHLATDGLAVQPRVQAVGSTVSHCWQRTVVPFAVLRAAARPGSVLERAAAAARTDAPVRYRIRGDDKEEDFFFTPPASRP